MRTFFDDVGDFHRKMKLPMVGEDVCTFANSEDMQMRIRFLQEELDELKEAVIASNLPEQIDALLDLAWVALGTAHYLRAPANECWQEIVRANMAKEPATLDPHKPWRGSKAVIKPPGWQGPDHMTIIQRHNDKIQNRKGAES